MSIKNRLQKLEIKDSKPKTRHVVLHEGKYHEGGNVITEADYNNIASVQLIEIKYIDKKDVSQ